MSAVKIPFAVDPVRTGSVWEQDIVFTLADRVTPQAAWAGAEAEVVLVPRSVETATEYAFRVNPNDVTVGLTDGRVRIRVLGADTAEFRPGDYNIEISRLDEDGERYPGAIGTVKIQQGLALIVDGEELLSSPAGDGAAGTIIITALGASYASGVGSSGSGLQEWKTITGPYTAVTGERLVCDSRTAAFNVTLPVHGGEVWLRDLEGSFSSHTVTALGNGRTIGGDASLECDEAGFLIHLISGPDTWGYTATYFHGEAA